MNEQATSKESTTQQERSIKVDIHPGPFQGPDLTLARACAMAILPWYGTDTSTLTARIYETGIWNDHPAVQAALAAIYYLRTHPEFFQS